MPKCSFNKVAKQSCKVTLRHECSAVNLLHIFRTPFLKNTCGWLLLIMLLLKLVNALKLNPATGGCNLIRVKIKALLYTEAAIGGVL